MTYIIVLVELLSITAFTYFRGYYKMKILDIIDKIISFNTNLFVSQLANLFKGFYIKIAVSLFICLVLISLLFLNCFLLQLQR